MKTVYSTMDSNKGLNWGFLGSYWLLQKAFKKYNALGV